MILVDVNVPSVENTYDFKLNEDALIGDIIGEVVQLVSQKERCHLVGESKELMLTHLRTGMILDRNKTLYESGVVSGDRLLLV